MYRSLEYLLKVRYVILVDPNGFIFLIFEIVFLCRSATLPYVWKICATKRKCFVAHTFTKHSQNVCLVNTYILVYWHARFDCKLWNVLWFYCIFGYFIHFWRPFMSEVWLYFHQTFTGMCLKSIHTFWYIDMLDVATSYRRIYLKFDTLYLP